MKLWNLFKLGLIFGIMNLIGVEASVICRGQDDIVVSTDKHTNLLNHIYICSKLKPSKPIAYLKDENGDGKITPRDTISYYFSKDFQYFLKDLSKLIHCFEDDLKDYYKNSGKTSGYYQVYIEDLLEMADGNKLYTDIVRQNISSDHAKELKEENDDYEDESIEDLYRQRYYDPKTSRFLSEEPLGIDGFNPYSYVNNNPINYIDPTGLYRERPPSDKSSDPLLNYLKEFQEGTRDFLFTYLQFKTRKFKNSDLYFHCLANCQASQAGLGGRDAAKFFGTLREIAQLSQDSFQSCLEDEMANRTGRNAGLNSQQSCFQSCYGYARNRLITPGGPSKPLNDEK